MFRGGTSPSGRSDQGGVRSGFGFGVSRVFLSIPLTPALSPQTLYQGVSIMSTILRARRVMASCLAEAKDCPSSGAKLDCVRIC